MAAGEDAATVLEGFIHDVANLPAEIAHLLEEIQAKDQMVQECRTIIQHRDIALQKHIRANGVITKHPKEEQYTKVILANYDKAQELQDHKVTLSQKAAFLLDRHVKKLDLKVRDLINDGNLMADSQLPSLLSDSPANLVGPASSTGTGANTPLLPLGLGAGGSTNIANAAMARMATSSSSTSRLPNLTIPTAGMQPSPLSITSAASTHAHRARESSLGATSADGNKRRRLQGPLGNITLPASNLRQSSLGPGTPRQNTPISRAGSAGPQRSKKSTVKHAANAPHSQSQSSMRKKVGTKGLSSSKKSSARRATGTGASAATSDNNGSGSDSDSASVSSLIAVDGLGHHGTHTTTPRVAGHDGALDSEDDDQNEAGYEDEGDDNKLYCICHSVSHGNMVACDNENCPYEWFHWECVGMTQEPKGRWLCTECNKLPPGLVKLAR